MFPGFTLDQLRDHVLDRFDVALALANPDEAACFSVLPEPTPGGWARERVQRLAGRGVAAP